MDEEVTGNRKVGGHQQRRPVDRVELEDVFADQLVVRLARSAQPNPRPARRRSMPCSSSEARPTRRRSSGRGPMARESPSRFRGGRARRPEVRPRGMSGPRCSASSVAQSRAGHRTALRAAPGKRRAGRTSSVRSHESAQCCESGRCSLRRSSWAVLKSAQRGQYQPS